VPTLETADGTPVDVTPADPDTVNREFARAMSDDGPDTQAPPPRQPKPATEAGAPKPKPRRGRPPKDGQARTADAAAPPTVDKDFTEECAGLTTLGWVTLAAVPPVSPWAVVVEANQDDLVKALNSGCQQNAKIRGAVEKWSAGSGGVYALQLAAVGVNMGVQSLQLLKDPALRAEARAHTQEKLRDFLKANGVKLADPAAAAPPPETADVPAAA
jgi:hypothetical protein